MKPALAVAALGVILAGLALPVLAGLGQTLAMAMGRLPGLEAIPATEPLLTVLAKPGLAGGFAVTLISGLGASLLALLTALALVATLAQHHPRLLRMALAPILAAPHAAMAIGLAFLAAPSGAVMRLLSPWATGLTRPPDIVTIGDGWGVALMLGLTVKELPFLLLVALAALPQLPLCQRLADGRALGQSPAVVWVWVIWPALYPKLRLSLFVALGFALSVVDMSLILGPSLPPSLAVWAVRLWSAPDLAQWAEGAALALLIGGLVVAAILAWLVGERAVSGLGAWAVARGWPGRVGEGVLIGLLRGLGWGTLIAAFGALIVLGVWSVAGLWRFPEAWPASLSLRAWQGQWAGPLQTTLSLALVSALLSLLVVVAWLEGAPSLPRGATPAMDALMLVPLLVPQIAFLPGLNIAFLRLGIDAPWLAVVLGHVIFVLPYMMLVLAGPWRRLDPRFERDAASLGLAPWARLWLLRLPLLLAPILTAFAVGFAVSVAQFLPTLLLGGGRVATLTTEAVALASGGDRRLAATHALLQALLPLMVFAAALLIPKWLWRQRAALSGAAP